MSNRDMSDRSELPLPQAILLLALDDESGGGDARLPIAAGVLGEMILSGAVEVDRSEDATVVAVASPSSDPTPLVDPTVLAGWPQTAALVADWVTQVRTSKKERSATEWIERIGRRRGLQASVAEPLVERGVLGKDDRLLRSVTGARHPGRDASVEAGLVARIREAVESDGPVSPRIQMLVGVIYTSGHLEKILDADLVSRRRGRILDLRKGTYGVAPLGAAMNLTNTTIIIGAQAGY